MFTKKHTNASPTSRIKWINISNFEAICFNLTNEYLSFDQPIPEFYSRNPGILESCLETPLQKFDNKDLYPTLFDKITITFYLLIKNHPFFNGNKRIAITTMLVLLYINGFWVETTSSNIYKLAKVISASNRNNKAKDLKAINNFILKNLKIRVK